MRRAGRGRGGDGVGWVVWDEVVKYSVGLVSHTTHFMQKGVRKVEVVICGHEGVVVGR